MSPTQQRNDLSREFLHNVYGVDPDTFGYIGPVYIWPDSTGTPRYLWKNIFGAGGLLLILIVLYSGVCCFGTFVVKSLVSKSTKRMHFQMLRLLLIQAIVPLIFEYMPCMMTVYGGFLGLPPALCDLYSLFSPVFISAYAPMEAFVTIIGFPVYRRRISRGIRPKAVTPQTTQMTSTVGVKPKSTAESDSHSHHH
ncbi:unnamed protein product, partial [Mesorhabditis spiculigera]